MALCLVDPDMLLLLMITLSASALSRNSSQDDLMPNDQGLRGNDVQKGCLNWQGMLVADGEKYVPDGNDMCTQCTCDKSFPIMCHSVACSPPLQCSNPQQVKEACCEYICLDDRAPKDRNVTDNNYNTEKDDGENITNLSLRLIASTVTSFLVLALLLFMVHRLRQRRLLLAMRRFEAQSRQGNTDDTDTDPYIPDAFLSLECPPYTDPPPPYSPPKPPQILPGEQPPPYDEISHNIDEANADENRNQIRGVTSSSSSGRGVQGNSGQGRTSSRSHMQVENDATCQPDHQHRSFELGHQRSGSDYLRAPNTLPAYASTDVVDGLGVVISPGSDMVCYSADWNTWLGARAEHDRHAVQTEARHQRSPYRGQFNSSFGSNNSRVQTMPTTTAFQRFSNIFKRDSWKVKNWRHQGRPVSDYSTPPHYATVPRNELSPRSGVRSSHPQTRGKNVSRPYSSRFPDTLCLSYDTGQATYTLGAVSPSTSSSNSSEHYEPSNTASTTVGSITTSTTPGTSSSGNSVSPPDRSSLMVDDFLVSPVHRQQFHDDLRRHLPPLQLSDVREIATPCRSDSTYVFSPKTASTEGTLDSALASQCFSLTSDLRSQHLPGQTFFDSVYTKETSLPDVKPVSSSLSTIVTSLLPSSSSTDQHSTEHQQQSLASFIRSNPLASTLNSRDHTAVGGVVAPQSLLKCHCPTVLLKAEDGPQLLSCSSPQACPKFFPTSQQGNFILTQRPRNSKEIAAVGQENRNGQELAVTQQIRNSHDIAVQEAKGKEIESAPEYLFGPSQKFQTCQPISPFSCSLSPISATKVCTIASAAPCINVSTHTTSATVCATSCTSSSPSPPPVSAASIGVLRRSQSGASQASMFSVCSETGEKKLKASDIFENNPGLISADSCYPENHRSRLFHYQEPQSVPVVGSLLPQVGAAGLCLSETHEHTASSNPSGCGNICDNTCQLNIGFHSLYSPKDVTLPMESSDRPSGGLVTTAAFPYTSITSSHPLTISNSSLMSSCGHQNESSWNSSSYNFNSLAEFDKSVAVKDVPLLYEGDRMTQSVNIPPLPPFVTAQSGKVLKHNLPAAQEDPGALSKSGKSHEILKKLKKKRSKDRNLSGLQCCNIAKHTSSSPKHYCLKTNELNKETGPLQKSECALKDKEATVRVMRPGDKKHRSHSCANRQHARLCDSLNCNKTMTKSASDAQAVYGNADVYRSIGGEGLCTALPYQQPTFGLWNQPGATGSCDHNFNSGTAINDLNQPPNYLKVQTENSSPSHAIGAPDGPVMGKGDLRKKGGHKRQTSAGDKAGHMPSPNRYKSRPKSLAAPDVHLNEKRVEVTLPRPSLTTGGDFGLGGKGARSGFGHDLNFDDQSGIADLHINEADFGNRRVSAGQDSHTQSSLGSTRKLFRVEGNGESNNVASKVGSSSYGYHPGSRSGLSNELSFTSRPTLASGHNKKRQSLPTGIGGASFPGAQDRASLSAGIAARSRQNEEGHAGQIRGEKSACQSERRVDKPVFVEDYIEATSYV